jgi:hypothetical protein
MHASNPVDLFDLDFSDCRWPVGRPKNGLQLFCGEPSVPGCSWCKEHRKRAFQRAGGERRADTP